VNLDTEQAPVATAELTHLAAQVLAAMPRLVDFALAAAAVR
jgi:hypothetical protein